MGRACFSYLFFRRCQCPAATSTSTAVPIRPLVLLLHLRHLIFALWYYYVYCRIRHLDRERSCGRNDRSVFGTKDGHVDNLIHSQSS
ncbi:hypothetical protein QVD17_36787 [Tagetes erecta]|uniref:Uncharacterized protein n=1 Tax=Tagetes erecta TaxID=13708 RepID=A0AAD8NIL7_TARER|nr:hypothetical protein QVD17_36787 [Tagetes erecta]